MPENSGTIYILDPCPEETPEEIGISSQLATLEGKVIGLLENKKYHADVFLQELQRVLEQKYKAKKVVYASKFTFSAACADETIESLIEECDAVVHGIAD